MRVEREQKETNNDWWSPSIVLTQTRRSELAQRNFKLEDKGESSWILNIKAWKWESDITIRTTTIASFIVKSRERVRPNDSYALDHGIKIYRVLRNRWSQKHS